MNALRRASAILARIEDGLAGLVLAAVLGVVAYELTVRGIFGRSNLWTDEMSRVLLIVMTYISAIGLTRDGAHVRVELLTSMLPPKAQAAMDTLSDLLCLLFALSATWLGYKYVQESALFGISFAHSNLPFPLWAAQSIIPIGFGAMSLRLVLRLIGIKPAQHVASVEA
ncbi:MAG TPA: TRAP transporter small permease [Pseudolabrys sp.]|nr:TRAP transporter small permease [Pseudolabrys sp.]